MSKKCNKNGKPPRLTLIFIVEQFPYTQLLRQTPYFKGGFKFLIENGINYTNANYPQGTNATGPGHAAMSSGALIQSHGIVANSWFENGVRVFANDDRSGLPSLVYTPTGTPAQVYPPSQTFGGKSNRNLLVDTIGDTLQFYSTPKASKQFFYVSLAGPESSNGLMPAGQLGKPFAFDGIQGGFTSTQAFYPDGLPEWVYQ